jgi:hypothetical protein
MINLSPEQIQHILADRKLQQIQREAVDKEIAEEKALRDAYWENKCNPQPTTTQVDHPCEVCKGTIQAGTQARKRTAIVNVSRCGYTGQPRTFYRHAPSCPVLEVKT